MDVPQQLFTDLNACKYLFLQRLYEPSDNKLVILIDEADTVMSARPTLDPPLAAIFSGRDVHPIEPTGRIFEIVWNHYVAYVAYSVRNESYAQRDASEVIEFGTTACVYSHSAYLDFVKSATFACNEYPGPFRHFGLNCLNHIIDVVSHEVPTVRLLCREPA